MPRKRYSEEQIAAILKEGEAGISAVELSRKYGVSQNTFYKWKNKFGGWKSAISGGCAIWRTKTGG